MNLVTDPKTLFERWFESAIAKLRDLPNGDGGTAGLMVVLPLFERYISILLANEKSGRGYYEIMSAELQLADRDRAKLFWTTFRHGFCHTGMPLGQGDKIKNLPKVLLSGEFGELPRFQSDGQGNEFISLDPWKFIDFVLGIYQKDPTLLAQRSDAPLLSIFAA